MSNHTMTAMGRLLLRIATTALVIAFAIIAVDEIVWRIRMAHGNGTDEVTVTQVTAVQLKRNREEYYFDGDITITCARSLLPVFTSSGWMPTCWYLNRHHTVIERP
ncbi:MAG: hypothetical protein V4734_09410 [Terriglobus sp.]